ncbi:endonuclease III [Spirochaetia bacterium 38H-sp]|uniref:Endonuclease III n=1 Tax=Rarispira pelagica TaxID=3141764 RepID=A0ABU9U8M3_9SPIR
MNKNFDKIYSILLKAYPDLSSFIEYKQPFELLIGVILSAQSTDRQVNIILPNLFARYPGAAELAQASQKDVEELIRSVGFYRIKAANIIKTADIIHNQHGGTIPSSMEELTALPGVGRKSANVIRGTIYGLPAIIVDTHFMRVSRRLGLTEQKTPEKIEKDLAAKIPPKKQYPLSMTVNRHGRTTCHARKPDCTNCILRDYCPKIGL